MKSYYLFFIDVVNSCKTNEQLNSAEQWIANFHRHVLASDQVSFIARQYPLRRAIFEKRSSLYEEYLKEIGL